MDAVRERYDRRKIMVECDRYSLLNASIWQGVHERQRVMLKLFARLGVENFENIKLLEVGCGTGDNLLEFLRLGFQTEKLMGIELLEERATIARNRLPTATDIVVGDAADIYLPEGSFDIVFQSTVFTSILDTNFQHKLADKMWYLTKIGGGVLWYDFVYDNPTNPDVCGVPLRRVKELFPEAKIDYWRLTLAPPISRLVTKSHSSLYSLFNLFPFLRTHILCWIQKEA